MKGYIRAGMLIAGILSLVIASQVGGVGSDNVHGITTAMLYLGYSSAVAGCILIFCAVLGVSGIPRSLIYLGKISYGLYVFHAGSLIFSERLAMRFRHSLSSVPYMFVVDGLALCLCVLAAHLSYRYFETPFLKLKERFEVIHSRPAD
jgi:peptidoglycan/LPS O-acetylase OafA/YrhL